MNEDKSPKYCHECQRPIKGHYALSPEPGVLLCRQCAPWCTDGYCDQPEEACMDCQYKLHYRRVPID